MAENATEVAVGGVVLAAALGFFVYAGQVTGVDRGGDGYELWASFRSVNGISVGTDVRLAGVRIGSVTGLDLNAETYRADTTFSIREGIEVPDDSAVSVTSDGLLGSSFIEIVPGGSPFLLADGGEIIDTQGSVSLVTLLMRAVTGDGE